jgi:hypothetical protein
MKKDLIQDKYHKHRVRLNISCHIVTDVYLGEHK